MAHNFSKDDLDVVSRELRIGYSVANELLLLANGDVEKVVECGLKSSGLGECKARIVNQRFDELEKGSSNGQDSQEAQVQDGDRGTLDVPGQSAYTR